MSDTSAIRNALNGHIDKQNQGDSATLRTDLTDTYYNALDQIYNLPYADTPSTTPSNTPTTPSQTTPAVQTPTVAPAPSLKPAAPQAMTPQGAGNWFGDLVNGVTQTIAGANTQNMQNAQSGIDTVKGAGITDPFASEVLGRGLGAVQSLASGVGAVAGALGGGINNIPVVGSAIEQGAGWAGGRYNEINAASAGINTDLTKLTNPLNLAGRLTNNLFDQATDQTPGFDFNSLASSVFSPTNPSQQVRSLAPSQPTQQLAAQAWTDLQKGNAVGAIQNALQMVGQYGDDEYNKLEPAEQLVASFAFDPLNFIPGFGIGEAQKAAKFAEVTKGVDRIAEAADLLPKGVMGKIMTPIAKVTEVVKTGLQNVMLRTMNVGTFDELETTVRAFETAGKDAQGFDAILKTMAGMGSIPAQRGAHLIQGVGKIMDELGQGYRALEGGIELAGDTSKLPKSFARFAEDVKAGRATMDDLLDVTKAELATRLQEHMAQNAAKIFPIKARSAPINVANRFLNELKGFEALAYIGLSPVTYVRNIVNGVTTMAIEGVNPLFNATGEINRLKKLGQLDRAAQFQRAVNLQKTMTKTGGAVRAAFNEGKFSTAQTGALGSFMSRMIQGSAVGAPLRWYEATEQAMRAKVWTNTWYKAISHNWDTGKWIPKMDAVTEAIAHQYRIAPEEIYNLIREAGTDEVAQRRNVLNYLRGKRGAAIDWTNVADNMGISLQELRSSMDEIDEAHVVSMFQELTARVLQGEDKAAVVEDVIARGASEYAQATAQRIGVKVPIAPADRLTQLEARMAEIDDAQAALFAGKSKIPKANREAYDALEGELNALQDEQRTLQESLGYTDEEMIFGKQAVEAKGATNVTDAVDSSPAGAVVENGNGVPQVAAPIEELGTPLDANPLPPADLPTQQLTQGQENARAYLLERKRPDGTPVYTAEQLATWRPDTLERIAGEMQMARTTFDDIMRTARDVGVPTATEKGAPNNRQLLNVLNKHKAADAERFATIQDVRMRADEAKQILESYTPQGKEIANGTRRLQPIQPASVDVPPTTIANTADIPVVPMDAGTDAATAIEQLREIAKEDEQATRILSRDEMVKAKARTQADILESLYNLWSKQEVRTVYGGSDLETRVMTWMRREVETASREAVQSATVLADWMDNAVMISRDGETVFDAAASVLTPFQFWRSRYALQSLRRVADKPARLAWYLKLRNLQDQVQNDPRYPKRLRGKMFIPIPGVPQWAGGGMWFDPMEQATSINSVLGLNQFPNDVTDQDVAASIRALAQRGQISLSEASNAIANGKGTLWDQTKQQLVNLSKTDEGGNAFTDMFRPHLPLDILWKLKTGNAADIGVLFPMTRLIRGATSMLPKGNALNPTGQGINIEQPLKEGLRALTGNQDIPDWDMWEQYRTDRALADMVGDGLINERDAMLALIERRGTFYEQAQQRAQEQMRLQNYSVFGGNIFPEGEKAYYKASVLRNQLIDQAVAQLGGNPASMSYGEKTDLIKANGLNKRGTPLGDFYTQHPEWNSRQDVFAEPEQRMKGFLTDEMWTRYNSLSALDKRLAKNANPALASFINNPQRDYDAVTVEKMGEWVKYMRGYLPESKLTPQIGAIPQVQIADPKQSARYQQILDQQDRLFNLDAMQPKLDTYQALSTNDKRAYRAVNKDVDAYFKWYAATMKANPDIDALIHSDRKPFAPYPVNTQGATNSVIRQVTSNLDRMAYRIGDASTRRYHAPGGSGGATGKPQVISAKAKQALAQKKANAGYFIPRDVYQELLKLFRANNGGITNFTQWLNMMIQRGGV